MSKKIRQLYKKSGISMRRAGIKKGKGLHTVAAHSCVINYIKKGFSAKEAWKRCIGALKSRAFKKRRKKKK